MSTSNPSSEACPPVNSTGFTAVGFSNVLCAFIAIACSMRPDTVLAFIPRTNTATGMSLRGLALLNVMWSLPSWQTAFGAISAINEAGLRIPVNISIISIDNVTESAYTHPPLTTFHIPKREMGILAMRILDRLISGDQEIPVKSIVYGDLLVRGSCRSIS